MHRLLRLFSGSLTAKLLLLAIVFLVVPAILYGRFEAADRERQELLLRNLQIQGRLVAQSLEVNLQSLGPKAVVEAAKVVDELGRGELRIKLLLRPTGQGDSFFYVAASPHVDPAYLKAEQQSLVDTGVLTHLEQSCGGNQPLATNFTTPSGQVELLTSITPFYTDLGCWAVITAYAQSDLAGESLTQPFAQTPAVRLAALFYAMIAVLFLILGGTMWLSLRRFADLARQIRRGRTPIGKSFAETSPVPELAAVAGEFDRLVATLHASARSIRDAAEENAHAFKAPLAAIAQSLEPLRRLTQGDMRGEHAVQVIDRAISRLDGLVAAARRVDETIAELMNAPRQAVNLTALLHNMSRGFNDAQAALPADQRVRVNVIASGKVRVAGTEEAIETVVENLIDNAISFSPGGSVVQVSLQAKGGTARMTIEDNGPGVAAEDLERIFERHFSHRPDLTLSASDNTTGDSHFGIGLAIVRRNVELMDGAVLAENRADGGLKVTVRLPIAPNT
jgi:two-component system sensor histidine kinase ChvG